jgi:hypothetical protein
MRGVAVVFAQTETTATTTDYHNRHGNNHRSIRPALILSSRQDAISYRYGEN